MPSSQPATSPGEYLGLARPASKSAACSSMVENSCGSSGEQAPKVSGLGVSLYGAAWPGAMIKGWLVYISYHSEWFEADGRCALVNSGSTRLAAASALSAAIAR